MASQNYITFRKATLSRKLITISFTLILLLVACLKAQAQANTGKKEITVLPVPAIGYSPETKTYVGAVTLFTFRNKFDSLTRTSNAKFEFNYTWNKQVILESDWNWFSPGEKWFSRGLIHYSKYPDLYYGVGFSASEFNEINFESNRLMLELDGFRNIKNKSYLGFGLNFKSYQNIEYINSQLLYPELKNKNSFGIKFIYLKDSRNNILTPSNGNYFEFNNSVKFSSSVYFKTTADYRQYLNWGTNKAHVLAGRFYHESIWGNPPFYDYAMIGGDEYIRGYYLGRFRDKNLSLIQLEYRTLLFWRIGVATFGGVAMIYDKVNNIQNTSFKPNAGVGLRFLVDEDENTSLRFDYAVGVGSQSGFYISFGESF